MIAPTGFGPVDRLDPAAAARALKYFADTLAKTWREQHLYSSVFIGPGGRQWTFAVRDGSGVLLGASLELAIVDHQVKVPMPLSAGESWWVAAAHFEATGHTLRIDVPEHSDEVTLIVSRMVEALRYWFEDVDPLPPKYRRLGITGVSMLTPADDATWDDLHELTRVIQQSEFTELIELSLVAMHPGGDDEREGLWILAWHSTQAAEALIEQIERVARVANDELEEPGPPG